MKRYSSLLLSIALGGTSALHAQSLAITNTIADTIGSTAIIAAPPLGLNASGTEDNTTTYTGNGVKGRFAMTGGLYMQVSTTGSTNLPTGRDSLMVARTVNSQGLEDSGTLSVYVRNPNSALPGASTATDRWTLDVNFAFFSDAGFTTPVTTNLLLTSLDIDYAQRYYTQNSDFTSNSTYFGVNGTDLIPAPVETGYTGFTTIADADSVTNDPEHGVSSFGSGTSFDVRLSHTSIALFMFEFRNPSQIIPEPSSSLLMLGGLSALGLMRRRTRNA